MQLEIEFEMVLSWIVFNVPDSLLVQFWIVFKVSYSLFVQFWILFHVPNSLLVELGAKDLLNSWIQTNNVQEGRFTSPLVSLGGMHCIFVHIA